MYYSKNHEGLVFIDRGMGNLEIRGEGVIRREDTETWNPDESWKETCTTLTVYSEITEIYAGVLEQFPNMKKLCLPKSVTRIDMTDEVRSFIPTMCLFMQPMAHTAMPSHRKTDCGSCRRILNSPGVGTRSMTRVPTWYCASMKTAR